MSFFKLALTLLATAVALVAAAPLVDELADAVVADSTSSSSSCFPALDFNVPSKVPKNTTGWWCDPSTEYAFLGFSYEVTACTYITRTSKNEIMLKCDSRKVKVLINLTKSSATFVSTSRADTSGYTDSVITPDFSKSVTVVFDRSSI